MSLTQYYTATSLDGFIADPNHSLDWLFTRQREPDGLEYQQWEKQIRSQTEPQIARPRIPARIGQTDDAGQDHLRRTEGVAVDRPGAAADAVEEAVQLALGVVEATGRRPAVRAAVDRLVAVLGAHPS